MRRLLPRGVEERGIGRPRHDHASRGTAVAVDGDGCPGPARVVWPTTRPSDRTNPALGCARNSETAVRGRVRRTQTAHRPDPRAAMPHERPRARRGRPGCGQRSTSPRRVESLERRLSGWRTRPPSTRRDREPDQQRRGDHRCAGRAERCETPRRSSRVPILPPPSPALAATNEYSALSRRNTKSSPERGMRGNDGAHDRGGRGGLPIAESRRLVAMRTGVIGYPDAHAIGVAHCSLRIAAALEVDDETRRAVAQGALLHDVGKLQIDEYILSKSSPLTQRERLLMGTAGRRAHRRPGGRPACRRGRDRASRALGRRRVSTRLGRRADSARGASRRRRRRVPRDVREPPVPGSRQRERGAPRAAGVRGDPVRSRVRRSTRRRGRLVRLSSERRSLASIFVVDKLTS